MIFAWSLIANSSRWFLKDSHHSQMIRNDSQMILMILKWFVMILKWFVMIHLWFSNDSHNFSWFSNDFLWFTWFSNDFLWFTWFSNDFLWFKWFSNDFLWFSWFSNDFLWFSWFLKWFLMISAWFLVKGTHDFSSVQPLVFLHAVWMSSILFICFACFQETKSLLAYRRRSRGIRDQDRR